MDRQHPLILLVEDNLDHAELARRGLERGCQAARVLHLRDGGTALRYLLDDALPLSGRPSLILLDLRLPGVDGLEVLGSIKSSAQLVSIPVVILSSSAAPGDITAAYGMGANSYLVKPADFAAITRQMNDLSVYWLGHNVLPE